MNLLILLFFLLVPNILWASEEAWTFASSDVFEDLPRRDLICKSPDDLEGCLHAVEAHPRILVISDTHDWSSREPSDVDISVMRRLIAHKNILALKLENPLDASRRTEWGRALTETISHAHLSSLTWSRERMFGVSLRESVTNLMGRGTLKYLSLWDIGNFRRDVRAYEGFWQALIANRSVRHLSISESFTCKDGWRQMCLALEQYPYFERLEISTLEEVKEGSLHLCRLISRASVRHMDLILPYCPEQIGQVARAAKLSASLESLTLNFVDICEDFPDLHAHFLGNFKAKRDAIIRDVRRRMLARLS